MKAIQPASVDAYMASFPENTQKRLQQISTLTKKIAPGAEELISYNMPGYK